MELLAAIFIFNFCFSFKVVAYANNFEYCKLLMILAVQSWLLVNLLLIKKCVVN